IIGTIFRANFHIIGIALGLNFHIFLILEGEIDVAASALVCQRRLFSITLRLEKKSRPVVANNMIIGNGEIGKTIHHTTFFASAPAATDGV
ncbi:MAG: hypothetical protein ACI4UL_00090, partial [Muribaculaceae bacterium]